MAAALYPNTFAAVQDGVFDWTSNDIRLVLLGPNFTVDFSAEYADQLPDADIIATSDPLANRAYEDGLATADAAEFLQLFDNRAISYVVLYQDVGDPAYSPLVAYYDADNILGAPLVSEGVDQYVTYAWPPGGFFFFFTQELLGEINSYLFAGPVALAELFGGDTILMPQLLLGGKLTVTTQSVCATPDEPEDCSPPTIRSSKCE